MTNNSSDRLDRIERILESAALQTEANARAIEADRITIREGIADVVSMIASLAEQSHQEREELRQRQAESDQRFETLLAEMRADRAETREAIQAIRALLEQRSDGG